MFRTYLTRIISIILILSILSGSIPVSAAETGIQAGTGAQAGTGTQPGTGAQPEETTAPIYDTESYINETIADNYTHVSSRYSAPLYTGEPCEIAAGKALVSGTSGIADDNYGYKNGVVKMTVGDTAIFKVEVPETAGYFYRLDYLSYDQSILPIELSMRVNGEYPFYEARRLLFETTWVSDQEKSYDRYHNEIVTVPDKLIRWETKYLTDASYRRSTPLILELQKGSNEIEFKVSEGSVLLGNMYLEKVTEIPEYSASEEAPGTELITIQAEDFTYRNDSSIHAVAEFESAVDPYEITDTILNTIDKDSFKDAGQTVTYEFQAEKDGYYNIALNYLQTDKSGFPVFINVAVDGVIPNTGFFAYPLDYTSKYRTITLKDADNSKLSVYLTKGTHSISFTIGIDNVRHVLEAVTEIMGEINDLSLEITKVAGTNKDQYRDLDLTRYIPNVQEKLYGWADELDALHESVKIYNPDVKKIAAVSSLSVASKQLRSLGKEPDELPYRVGELATSVNSINVHLANLIDSLNKNKLAIDRIYLYQEDAKLPKGKGFFESLFLSIRRFFASFFDQAYSTSNVNEEHLQVWVNRPRQFLEIMQKLIDEQFTPATGIEVDLSLMPDPNKLVLANSSDDAPDIATSINYAIPFELGIRGAIKDLTEFEDFTEIANRYQAGLHIPATIGDGIYALPETMNFWVLFYRTDVLDKLGLKVPDTMEDLVDMLPELQMRGLNFFYPTAAMLALRNFHGTTPLLFQNGAALYGEYAGNTALNSEEAVKGLTELTELFTIYNLPKDVPNFYQHFRNGDLPIGISDYATYNLLVNAAPEIADSWDIALVPGVKNEDGEVLRYMAGGADSTVMFRSTKEREDMAWEFMKWWSSAPVQTEYGQTLQISYGDEYIWNTANLEAFEQLPWDTGHKQIIREQSAWVLEAPRILGTYMLERELSNAYNDIVVNGKTLRTRVDKAVKIIDRETERKLEEFGYLKDGKVIKEYVVPNIDTVNEILGNAD
jgi:ABC-type glycerol-3-phosphate transport system substrate-binding protein